MMAKPIILFLLLAVLAISITGCVTTPAPQGQTYSAGYVGDRDSLPLGEQVFTIRVLEGPISELRNLHVRLEVVINPRSVSLSSEYEVGGIIRRLEPRVKARLADYVPLGQPLSIQALAGLKEGVAREAQTTLLASYSKWKKAADYDVQVVVTGFHLTDLSAGTPATTTRGWW